MCKAKTYHLLIVAQNGGEDGMDWPIENVAESRKC